MEKVEQVERLANIDAIASELVALAGNDPVIVRSMAASAKYLRIGDPVQHLGNPSISGVVGKAVTESLCVAVTTDDNLSGASCFCDPRNLRIEATRANDEEIARYRAALELIANHRPLFDYVGCDDNGINDDVPGSPYDRGKEAGVKLLAEVARKALGASNA